MNIIRANDMQFAMGHVKLLDQANFALHQQEKVGLIGRNGTGKSSFLKILAGKESLDQGTIHIQNNLKIVYLSQEANLNPEDNIFNTVAEGLGTIKTLLQDYHNHSILVTKHPENKAILEKLNQLQLALEAHNGWQFESIIQQTLSELNLPADELIKNLSGGQKKRVQLAQAWIQDPDLLLLDEPTNHLDIDTIIWLENLLSNFKGSLIVVTHDRRFLDNVVTRIVELDRGILNSYLGNFQQYQYKKNQELQVEIKQNQLTDKFHAQEEAWIRQGIEARRTRNEGRVRRLEELRRQRQARREVQGKATLTISESQESGKIIAEFKHMSFAYPNKRPVIHDYTGVIRRGDKIGLIGPNGIGKSTLLKLILGELEPSSGEIIRGTQQKIAYFDQFRSELKETDTLFYTLGQGNHTVTINGKDKHVMSYLQDFLFHPSRSDSPVSSLSGGEKNRLLLAKLFTKPANILILDEPTNDLDIETQELLEQMLKEFTGTVFLVSHDRELLDSVITQSIVFEGQGQLTDYIGGYEDYLLAKQRNQVNEKVITTPASKENRLRPNNQRSTTKLSFKEKRELEALPSEIEALEQEQKALTEKLLQTDVFKYHYQDATQWQQRVDEIEQLLDEKLTRWEWLDNKQQSTPN